MTLKITPWHNDYLEAAATLAARCYRQLRSQVPELPAAYADTAVLLPLLNQIADAGSGVVALEGGRPVGYYLAWLLPALRGQRSTYSPEWANGAEAGGSARIYQAMYAGLAERWAAERYFDHYVTLLAHDRPGIDALHWLGFGDVVIDALRNLAPVAHETAELEIRQAGPDDAEAAKDLHAGLLAHLAAAPIFLVDAAESSPEEIVPWLANPANALWLAWQGGEAVASVGIQPANENACTVIRDAGTASITSAFTRPAARGGQIATALLDRALAWASARGYVRCAVDFETANLPASHFWLRHFAPICHSLGRRVNPRIAEVAPPAAAA